MQKASAKWLLAIFFTLTKKYLEQIHVMQLDRRARAQRLATNETAERRRNTTVLHIQKAFEAYL